MKVVEDFHRSLGTMAGLSNFLCEAPPRPFFCEGAESGGARLGTLTHFFWGGAAFAEGSWRELESPGNNGRIS